MLTQDELPAYRLRIEHLFEPTAIRLNGNNTWDIRVLNDAFYRKVCDRGLLGLFHSYVDGDWECERIDKLFFEMSRKRHLLKPSLRMMWPEIKLWLISKLINMQSRKRAFQVGKMHYDIGNDLFEPMLGPTMAYSCGFYDWGAVTLDQAQEHKFELICLKLGLRPGMKVLDVGCGWGGLAAFMVKKYGVEVTGITVAEAQISFIERRYGNLFSAFQMEYRDLSERYKENFDRIVSVGMFEHVGPKNYRSYMRVMANCLKTDGFFLLHTIGGSGTPAAWVHEGPFVNGVLPNERQITRSFAGIFTMRDWHNFGANYDTTLMTWAENCKKVQGSLSTRYDVRFWRYWYFYLYACAGGGFRSGHTKLWQIVLSKNPETPYRSVRERPLAA